MVTENSFDILDEVRRYLTSATPEVIAEDIRTSDFESFIGVGPVVGHVEALKHFSNDAGATHFSTQLVFKTIVASQGGVAVNPYTIHTSMSLSPSAGYAGNYEEMPLAA